jgi:rhodanese-related sulfurtransferase
MVVQLSNRELKEKLDAGEPIMLIDVREPLEHEEYNIGGDLIPLGTLMSRLDELDKNARIVTYCRSGSRSNMAAQALVAQGFTDVSNLQGGMLGWREAFGE